MKVPTEQQYRELLSANPTKFKVIQSNKINDKDVQDVMQYAVIPASLVCYSFEKT